MPVTKFCVFDSRYIKWPEKENAQRLSELVVAVEEGDEGRRVIAESYRVVSFSPRWWKCPKLDCGDGCITCDRLKTIHFIVSMGELYNMWMISPYFFLSD